MNNLAVYGKEDTKRHPLFRLLFVTLLELLLNILYILLLVNTLYTYIFIILLILYDCNIVIILNNVNHLFLQFKKFLRFCLNFKQ